MIREDEDALICDLAETYHIYDYNKLSLTRVACFAVGLKDDSRIKMKLSGQKVSTDTLLLAGIVDRLSILLWAQTKDSQKGINRPTMILDSLVAKENKDSDVIVFNSGEDFEKTRNEIINRVMAGGD
ncbi:DUF5361 domain-containing protein [Paratissierella segnis]|jgi:hypothetical protein|uniref:Phage protein n=1 Tax=Paratissierella segnis TaxID=2763679 RepID=A0A926EXD2_9FIRM|nr:DUF5361 domain-containing protein [Paratissierella segnis]MBC8589326.1 hypothetical protein [Paratissierella segnis]